MNSNQDRIFEWYDFLKYDLKPDKVNINYIRPPSARPKELIIDKARYDKLVAADQRRFAARRHQEQLRRRCRILQGRGRYLHARADREDRARRPAATAVLGGHRGRRHLRRRHGLELRDPRRRRQSARTTIGTFSKLWYSPADGGRRETVANGCFCTHESNCYYPSLPFNPRHLIEIKKLEHEMKEAASTSCECVEGVDAVLVRREPAASSLALQLRSLPRLGFRSHASADAGGNRRSLLRTVDGRASECLRTCCSRRADAC